jgi:hypothetical protein
LLNREAGNWRKDPFGVTSSQNQKKLVADFIKDNNLIIEEFLEAGELVKDPIDGRLAQEICERKVREILKRETGWVTADDNGDFVKKDFGNVHTTEKLELACAK